MFGLVSGGFPGHVFSVAGLRVFFECYVTLHVVVMLLVLGYAVFSLFFDV